MLLAPWSHTETSMILTISASSLGFSLLEESELGRSLGMNVNCSRELEISVALVVPHSNRLTFSWFL